MKKAGEHVTQTLLNTNLKKKMLIQLFNAENDKFHIFQTVADPYSSTNQVEDMKKMVLSISEKSWSSACILQK